MRFRLKAYKDLSVDELYETLKLRCEIFVIEQNCNYQDMDGKDKTGWHLMGFDDNELKAYARILPQGVSYPEASIGRVVVSENYRGRNAGKELMKEAIKNTRQLCNTNEIVIGAQEYLLKFYGKLGFIKEGEMYLEDDIPHIKMRLKL